MKSLKVKAPAKINLTLEVLNKREDGFHNIKSIMQAINLYDYLTVTVDNCDGIEINLDGNSKQIPYNEKNLVYKAAIKFLEKTGIKDKKISFYIEKNIPVEAGLAGGSTDGAAAFFALNKLFDDCLTKNELHELCTTLGSDLNFCLEGGTCLCTSRGEITQPLPTPELDVCLIKPLDFGISAKEAYTKFSQLKEKKILDNTEKIIELLKSGRFDNSLIYNSLEKAVFDDYDALQNIKLQLPSSLMSGSGPTYFVLQPKINCDFGKDYLVIEGLKSIRTGVEVI